MAKSTVESLVFPADATNATVTGLDLFSKYCFQLLVFNEDFDGVRSERVCAGKKGFFVWNIGSTMLLILSSRVFRHWNNHR